MKSWDYITHEATDTDGMTIKEVLQFHYFNPNGLNAEYRAQCDKIVEMVDAGTVPNGWHLAYGCLADNNKKLRQLIGRKRVNGRVARSCLDMLRWHIDKTNERIAEVENTSVVDNIKQWANAQYDNMYGATVLVECYTDEELAAQFKTLREAIDFAKLKTEQYEEVQP